MTRSNGTLTAIRGVRVGHAQDRKGTTGTTVVLLEPPAMAFADSRGGWPGSYDTAASNLGKTFVERHALFLTGGDVFGFDAAKGIQAYVIDRRLAKPRGAGSLPGVMGTNIYDLGFADVHGVDYAALGREACEAASSGPVPQGNVGAGSGATVGPFLDFKGHGTGTKGGLGASSARAGPWTVGALFVSNCVGNVFDPFEGQTIGGTLRKDRRGFLEMDDVLDAYLAGKPTRAGTTIGVLGTDAPLDHEQLARIVELAHDGIALAVRPAHMSTDGDTILGFSTGTRPRTRVDHRALDVLAHVAVRETARAIVNAVRAAASSGGVTAYGDLTLDR
ncbi:MAG: hypothetical protein A3K68_00830 [Euryarchaeota archaeon RBG_16_68_13]|nr:MAG: hypothetical protein A3K68_00830 [Euryarchaeota archaeon RBG_16_68_13]